MEASVLTDPPASPRRTRVFVPGAIAAHGQQLWIADLTRPVVVRLDHDGAGVTGRSETVATARWTPTFSSAAASSPRKIGVCLQATQDGCWVSGAAGVVHIDADMHVTPIDAGPSGLCAYDAAAGLLYALDPPGRGLTPSRLRVLHRDGLVRTVDLPGPASAVAVHNGAALIVIRLPGERPARLETHLSRLKPGGQGGQSGPLEVGPALPVDDSPRRLALLGATNSADVTTKVSAGTDAVVVTAARPGRGSGACALVTDDLTLGPSRPLPAIAATPNSAGVWRAGDRLFIAVDLTGPSAPFARHHPDGDVEETATDPVTVAEVDLTTGAVSRQADLPWRPSAVVASDQDVWLQGLDHAVPTRPVHRLVRWSTSGALTTMPTGALTPPIEIEVPNSDAALQRAVDDQATMFVNALGSGSGSLDMVEHRVVGGFPDTCLVVAFRPTEAPQLLAATAFPLFTLDGLPRRHPGPFHDVEMLERLTTGGINALRAQDPDPDGLRWLDRPAAAEGQPPTP